MSLRLACLSAAAVATAPSAASAVQYEVFVDVEIEDDLYDLLVTDQISSRSFDALLELHQTRVDLNRAGRQRLYLLPNIDYKHVDRILSYRKAAGTIHELGDLIAAGVLDAQLARALSAFVIIQSHRGPKSGVSGFVRTEARWTGRYDRLPPAAVLQSRVKALRNLDAGVAAALTRNRLGRPHWDASRHALSVGPERTRFELPKLYVEWEDESWEVIAGTYRIGFGQRLTFDVTDQVTPNGFFGDYEIRRGSELRLGCRRGAGELLESPCPSAAIARVTPDHAWTSRLAGVAAGMKRHSMGPGWLQSYGWGSFQVHPMLQSEVVVAGVCRDPRRDEESACQAPDVFVLESTPGAAAPSATFATLPAMYGEGLAGINATYFWNARAHLGATSYGAFPKWLVRGVELGFQESARKPFGGPFGAVGIDAAYGFGKQDLFVEVTRSFDSQPEGGGGFGMVARSVTTFEIAELEISARHYGTRYANPYARPISQPDELDGLRARDESGLRVRSTLGVARRVSLRLLVDGWRELSSGALACSMFARADLKISPSVRWAAWAEVRLGGTPRLFAASQLAYEGVRRVAISAQFQHRSLLDAPGPRRVQHDVAAIFNVTGRPVDLLRLRVRIRYDFEDVFDNQRLSQALWAHAEAAFALRDRDTLRLRYDVRVFLDHRESTRLRVPNPEHWLWLEYIFRY